MLGTVDGAPLLISSKMNTPDVFTPYLLVALSLPLYFPGTKYFISLAQTRPPFFFRITVLLKFFIPCGPYKSLAEVTLVRFKSTALAENSGLSVVICVTTSLNRILATLTLLFGSRYRLVLAVPGDNLRSSTGTKRTESRSNRFAVA